MTALRKMLSAQRPSLDIPDAVTDGVDIDIWASTIIQAISEAEHELGPSLANLRIFAPAYNSQEFVVISATVLAELVRLAIWALQAARDFAARSGVTRLVTSCSQHVIVANGHPHVELWCQRARAQLLTIHLDLATTKIIDDGAVLELRVLLESYVPQWGMISAAIQPLTIYVLERSLDHSSPLLHTLTLIAIILANFLRLP